jgi:hypothetical protein
MQARVESWRFPSMRFQGGSAPIRVRYPIVFTSRLRRTLELELTAAQQLGDGVRDPGVPALIEVGEPR